MDFLFFIYFGATCQRLILLQGNMSRDEGVYCGSRIGLQVGRWNPANPRFRSAWEYESPWLWFGLGSENNVFRT